MPLARVADILSWPIMSWPPAEPDLDLPRLRVWGQVYRVVMTVGRKRVREIVRGWERSSALGLAMPKG
jgi:hypothetical protein